MQTPNTILPLVPARDAGRSLAVGPVLIYLTIYTFESPIRYVLSLANLSPAILARDALILVPLAIIGVRGLVLRNLHPAFWYLCFFIFLGDVISYLNFGLFGLVALGSKMLANVLLGVAAGASLVVPGKWVARYMLALWLATLIGLVLEKYVTTFPWVGMHTVIGGVDVEISRDWQIADPNAQRVGGFTKESISAAGLLSELALVAVFQFRSYLPRMAVLAMTMGGVYLTTQKGALIALALVTMLMSLPAIFRLPLLRLVVAATVLLDVALPLLTSGLMMSQGHGGVFSMTSFAERVDDTWPNSLLWISHNEIFPFGDGMGGIGQSQSLLGNVSEHYPDNIFLILYSFFGLPCLLFFAWIICVIGRSFEIDSRLAEPALAVLAFLLLYGIVVTIVEDQDGSFFLGATLGLLATAPRLSVRQTSVHRSALAI